MNIGTAIADQEFETMSIYPNPATDQVFISSEVESIDVLDASMRMVKSVRLNSNSRSINISELNAGLYFLKSENSVGRLIVQ